MKILITGTAGRVGRAIYIRLMKEHQVVGLDRTPCSTADFVGDLRDRDLMDEALQGVQAIVHTAALHAPHVGLHSDHEFEQINVEATEALMRRGIAQGLQHFLFTSTTALYGRASTPDGTAGWVDETTVPLPRSIYHRSKIAAEARLEVLSSESGVPVTVLQMSRCFPEPADLMAVYRLHRGIDARDVAAAHALAIERRLEGFRRFIISGATPFTRDCCRRLYGDAPSVIRESVPALAEEFERRGWAIPGRIDRVYDSSAAQRLLDWQPQRGWNSVLEMLDDESAEVLPLAQRTMNGA